MLNRILKGLSLIVVFAAIMLLMAPANILATGNDDHGGGGGGQGGGGSIAKAKGSIAAMDLAAGSLTISDRRTGQLVTVTADASTQIRKNNDKNALLSDLAVGDRAEVRFDSTSFLAISIRAKSAKVEGLLTAVDLSASTVTITPLGGSPVALNVTAATKIQRNEIHVPLSALVVGDAAEARFDASTMTASKLETTGI